MRMTAFFFAFGLLAAAPALAAEGPANFGGNGVAWEILSIGGSLTYGHSLQDTLAKDWATPDGEIRFTNPGNAEGKASGNSAIRSYPCPGTQVYPKKK